MSSKSQKGKKKQSNVQLGKGKKDNSLKKYYYLFAIFTFFIFANSIGNGYNMDDSIVTNDHPLTSKGLSAIGEIFTSPYYSDDMGYAYGYRPIVHVSFAIEHELFGEKPEVGHFFNVLLFTLSVVMFFKLLIKWVGKENLLFAGISTLLFAVHPIHTEVVNSLKNRDELLAFLFVIWAALSVHRFLDKKKWSSLISIIILFSLAMLSKKSIYPMAIVIPAAIILLKDISIKQFIILGLSFIIPAAIIGSELKLGQMGLMIVLPIIVLMVLYMIRFFHNYKEKFVEQFLRIRNIILVITILLVGLIAIFTSSIYVLLISLPFLVWLFKYNFEYGLFTLIILLLGLDLFWLSRYEIQLLLLLLGLGYGLYSFFKTKKINKWWIGIALLSIAYFLIFNHKLEFFGLFINLILFIFLLHKKALWAIFFSIITLAIPVFFGEINLYAIEILLISVFFFIYQKTNNKNWIQYVVLIVFTTTLGFVEFQNFRFNKMQSLSQTSQTIEIKQQLGITNAQRLKKNEKTSFLKEGRVLEYVENTLVAKHTTQEKIGTGFATLGEYFRLMVFPYELSFYYGFAKVDTFNLKSIWIWLIILIHIGMLFLAISHIKKKPMISIGVFWYLLSILLFSNWVELVAGMVGERLAFTASAGFCIFLVGVLFWIKPDFSVKKPGIIGLITILVLALFTGRTIIRNTDWKDTITLMGSDIDHLKNSAQANSLYAMNLMAESTNNQSLTMIQVQEMQEKALEHFNRAIEVWPDYYNAYIDKARVYIQLGDYQAAIKPLETAIKIDPKNEYSYYIIVDVYDRLENGESYLKYAKILFDFRQDEQTYGILARGYYLLKDLEKSREVLLEALQKYPNSEGLQYNLNFVNQEIEMK